MCSYLLKSGRKRVIYITESKATLKQSIMQLSWLKRFDNALDFVSGKSVVVICSKDRHYYVVETDLQSLFALFVLLTLTQLLLYPHSARRVFLEIYMLHVYW